MEENTNINTEIELEITPQIEELQTDESQNIQSEVQTIELQSKPELNQDQKNGLLEALLFACGEPLTRDLILHVTGFSDEELSEQVELLKAKLSADDRGIELALVASKFQLRTKPIFAAFLRELKAGGPRKLTAAALETLSIIAYRQPIVKSDIEKIRGVDATPTLKTLIDRELIRIIGHQASAGQPALYGTTENFLSLFGLNALEDLPTLREIAELERDPGEVEEMESESSELDTEGGIDDEGQTAEVSI